MLRILASLAALAVGALLAAAPHTAPAETTTQVAFPDGYREWRHVKSMIIEPGHALAGLVEGTHHVYANPKALRGYAKQPFSDGSVLVFDLFETQRGDKAIAEGPRKAVIVMRKDAKRFAATGGWGYEVFAGGDPAKPQVGVKAAQMCHSCHLSQQKNDYVFSQPRD